ncbi:MAG: hypothetical protein HY749_23905 [Gammaproteobacteria bacterium]|nr:hypothetical protein [Gammaproteobacteria bacterium]MBI5617255.1 hypothetical protein [Gammaproteobacteria bacterium]
MTALLTSVRDLAEAELALGAGSEWLDLKEPRDGALGRVAPEVARDVVRWVAGRVPVSATIGDCWDEPECFAERAAEMAATGVSHVKIGLYARDLTAKTGRALAAATAACPIIAVCFAEEPPAARDVARLAAAGLRGVMLDTAEKQAGSLRSLLAESALREFVTTARGAGLLTGLAGSLSLADVPPLLALGPDYLGFRGALCVGQAREAMLSADAVAAVKAAVARGRQV